MILIKNDTSFIDFNKPSIMKNYINTQDTIDIKLFIKNKISNKEHIYIKNIINSNNRLIRVVLNLQNISNGFYVFIFYIKNINTNDYDKIEQGLLLRDFEKPYILKPSLSDDDFILTI